MGDMKLLAFETSDSVASVALLDNGVIDSVTLRTAQRHAESVLPAAEELLRKHGLTTSDMDAFAVDVGPGSFTGVRIGVCLANALALAHGKPVIPVDALEALYEAVGEKTHSVSCIIDARNGNGYAALFSNGTIEIAPHACVITEFLAKCPEGCLYTGTGTEFPELPNAASVAMVASRKKGSKQVSPNYLKPSQAERMWKPC